MSFLRRCARPALTLLLLGGVLWGAPVAAGERLFADEVALSVHGEGTVGFLHEVEPDADGTVRPGTRNILASRFRLEPELWINEFVQIRTGFLATARFGDGGAAGRPDGESPPVDLALSTLDLRWQTPAGTFTAGRSRWHWGLGLFEHDGRMDLDRYGIPEGTGARDQLTLNLRPLGLAKPLDLILLARQWHDGERSPDAFADAGWSVGAGVLGRPETLEWGALLRYDTHPDAGLRLMWVDGYLDWRPGKVRLAAELAGRYGRADNWTRIDLTTRTATNPRTDWWGAGGVLQFDIPEVRAGSVRFAGTGFEFGYLSGDALDGSFEDARWTMLAADTDYRVGMLLLPRLWPHRRDRIAADQAAAAASFTGGDPVELRRELDTRWGEGMGNVLYVYPGFGLRTDGDLRFRLNALYARTARRMPTLEVADSRGTAEPIDDLFVEGRDLGFELNTHLSAPLWGRVFGVLEAGVAFPGNAFRGVQGQAAPTAFAIAPRLTVLF